LDNNHPMLVRKCDPALADEKGAELREAFAEAERVHVLSCRFNKTPQEELARAGCKKMKKVLDDEGKWRGQWFGGDKDEWRGEWVEDESGEYLCTEPKYAASAIKQFLEEGLQRVHLYSAAVILPKSDDDDVCVFNPNSDNAFLFSGDPLSANVAWVRAGWDSNRGLSRARLEGPTRRVPVRWQLDTSPGAKSGSRTPRRRAAGASR
jgi:hypothetical protein